MSSCDYGDDVSETHHLVALCLSQFRHGSRDRTCEMGPDAFRRATWTPDGPGVLEVRRPFGPSPDVCGHGPGGSWLVQMWTKYRGDHDSPAPVVPRHQAVERAQRRWGLLRLGASGSPYHELIPTILGQRITAKEAYAQWYRLVDRFGEPAPDPLGRLMLPPSPHRLASLGYHELHPLGIEKKRADCLRNVGSHARWLLADWYREDDSRSPSDKTAALLRVPGVGVWTAAVAGGVAFGDPDALQIGDFHVKNTVAWALEGSARGTDDQMKTSLSCYIGQRHRVVRWLELDGWRAPLRGPRRRILSIGRL